MWQEAEGGMESFSGLGYTDLLRGLAAHYEHMQAENNRLRAELTKHAKMSPPSHQPSKERESSTRMESHKGDTIGISSITSAEVVSVADVDITEEPSAPNNSKREDKKHEGFQKKKVDISEDEQPHRPDREGSHDSEQSDLTGKLEAVAIDKADTPPKAVSGNADLGVQSHPAGPAHSTTGSASKSIIDDLRARHAARQSARDEAEKKGLDFSDNDEIHQFTASTKGGNNYGGSVMHSFVSNMLGKDPKRNSQCGEGEAVNTVTSDGTEATLSSHTSRGATIGASQAELDDKRAEKIEKTHTTKKTKTRYDLLAEERKFLWWVNSEAFGLLSAGLIIANSIYIGVQADYMVRREINKAGGRPYARDFDWMVGDFIFTLIFTVELILRVMFFRWGFIMGSERNWNLFDTVVVVSSVIEVGNDLAGVKLNMGISVLRTLRVARIIRVLRSANLCSIIRNLKTMLYSLVGSASSFLSALILLAAIMYIFGLVFMQGVTTHLKNDPNSSQYHSIGKYYGSLGKTFWTLICAVTGGYDWGLVSDPITECGWFYLVLFLLYISFVLLGLMNILNGIFVNAALQSSAMNRELAIHSILANRDSMIEDMVHLFLEADADRSGTVSWEEFQGYLQDEKIKAYFMSLELDMTSVVKIFELLDVDNTGELELVEFVEGCIALRGNAKMVDLSILQKDYSVMVDRFDEQHSVIRQLQESMSHMDQSLDKSFSMILRRLEHGSDSAHAPQVHSAPFLASPQLLPSMEA